MIETLEVDESVNFPTSRENLWDTVGLLTPSAKNRPKRSQVDFLIFDGLWELQAGGGAGALTGAWYVGNAVPINLPAA